MKKSWKKLELTKVWKQVREWKQVQDRAQDLLCRTKFNSKAFVIPILTALINYYKPDVVRIGIANAL